MRLFPAIVVFVTLVATPHSTALMAWNGGRGLFFGPAALAQRQGGAARTDGRYEMVSTTSVIRGRVTTETGGPVRGADVRIREAGGRENRIATTDSDGNYEARDLLPGNWNVTASKSGFITQQYGQRRPFAAPEVIELGASRALTIDFILRRAGAIGGRIFDEFGDPVAGARVQVLRSRMTRGRRSLAPTGVGDQTDDTGAFRLYALPPGDYYVGASLRAATPETPSVEAVVGVPTYYPGTPSIAEAQRIRLGPSEEQAGISFALSPVRPVRVSGVVLSSTGAPAEDASLQLQSTSDISITGVPLGNFGMTQPGGVFTIVNVAPGSYLLSARVGAVFNPMEGQGEEALVPITVTDDDITGLTITTSKNGFITGTIVTENGAPFPRGGVGIRVESPARMTQFENRVGGRAAGAGGPPPFRLPRPLGVMSMTVNAPDGWMLKSIEINGTDVTDGPFESKEPQNIEARITLTDRITEVSGAVTSGARAAPDAQVIVFPDEATKWVFPSRHVKSAATDGQGAFRLRGLPPHDRYLALAVDYLDEGELQDPELLERLKERATAFSIDFGERRTLNLRLMER